MGGGEFALNLGLALGLALVLEGLAYALFARPLKRLMMEILAMPEFTIRLIGLTIAAVGVVVIWLVRG